MTNIVPTATIDILPPEMIFLIFEYLTNNDIIYIFFDLNQRFHNLLVQNQGYLTSLVLPTTNLDIWKNILLFVGPQIECLTIENDELTIPLEYFPNLKSIVYFLPFGSSEEQIKLILQSDQFQNFHSLKIKRDKSFSNELFQWSINNQDPILDKVFNNKNSLQTFEYSKISLKVTDHINTDNFMINLNLHSLILTLVNFNDIYPLIEYTPNLEYLNIYSQPPTHYHKLMNKIKINLKKLHLKFTDNLGSLNSAKYAGNLLLDIIKRFSSSLICLSLNLINLSSICSIDKFPFNSTKLQEFLESMKELKQFHLYAQINNSQFDNDFISTNFCDQYWFDHNWSFGMHGKYLYTLPFYFNDLHEFPNNFNNIQSNNPDILLEKDSKIWFNVKSLELSMTHQYDFNFVKELKIKMPKLNLIKFKYDKSIPRRETEVEFSNNDRENRTDLILNRVTTIQVTGGSIQQIKQWLINSLPYVKHLILSSTDLSSIDNQIGQTLNQRIQQLDISEWSSLENLTEISYVYFSNVEYINFESNDHTERCEWHANIIMKILVNFKNLKRLLIYPFYETYSTKVSKCLNMDEIQKNYQIKHYQYYCVFSKIFS